MAEAELKRHIAFDNCFNFRDLGGYTTEDGRMVRWRRIFRSGELHYMSDSEVAFARNTLGISTILDVREAHVAQRDGAGLLAEPPVHYLNIPLIDDVRTSYQQLGPFQSLLEDYLGMYLRPEVGRRTCKILAAIASSSHPIVFHCSAGKDRSGVTAGVMLRLLGVPIDQVAEDYSLTRLHLEPIYARIRHDRQLWEFVGRLPSWTRDAAPETMAGFLQVIDHKYGSMRGYVTAHGLDTDVLNKLETALLTD